MILPWWVSVLSPRLKDPIVWICVVLGVITVVGVARSAREVLRLAKVRTQAERASRQGPAQTQPAASAAEAALRLRQANLRRNTHPLAADPKDSNPMRGFKTWCAHCKTPEHNALNCPRVNPVVLARPNPNRNKEEEHAV